MKTNTGSRGTGWVKAILHDILQPEQTAGVAGQSFGQLTRQGLAVVLSVLMIMIPMGQGMAFAQSAPPENEPYEPPAAEESQPESQPAPQAQPLSSPQLEQLVAPIALYPDALVAQILVAATYPTQVVEADRWLRAQGNAAPEQIAAGAEVQNWDPSVKALTAFPTVLAQMDQNLGWTTDLGNAYYNQPQDVMDAVQVMRQKAQAAGQLRSTPQQTVADNGGAITIAPANPTVVYVPVYDPWVVYGAPIAVYPGYYYAPPPGVFWGGLAIGFGIGIGIGFLAHWAWGWPHWGLGWYNHAVFFNHATYITHSTTVINRGFNRPGGPPRYFGARGAYPARTNGAFNRPGGSVPRPPSTSYRASSGMNRPGGSYQHSTSAYGRPSGPVNRSTAGASRPAASYNRPAGNVPRPPTGYHASSSMNRPSGNYEHSTGAYGRSPAASHSRPTGNYGGASSPRPSVSRGPSPSNGGGYHPSGGGSYGGHPSGGGHASYSGHASGGGHFSGGGHGGGRRG